MPLSCGGVELEAVKLPLVTLIDALDTLAVLGDASEFVTAVGMVATFFKDGFDYDVDVSVFETTIRILGGLLSAHLMASDADLRLFPGYDDSLLDLAFDLGIRLLPAFATPTGIPYGTVNLRSGVPKGESTVSNLAGAGSLAIEFGALSILTHDARFGSAGRGAVKALHDRRSTSLGLLGKHVSSGGRSSGQTLLSIEEHNIERFLYSGPSWTASRRPSRRSSDVPETVSSRRS
ncbi:glycoside hydrolase [Pelagophyceae sp. CCMP2097]|nr:glycoside hydrolase [Pelagophyceae sp. CCMP2097]